LQDSLRRAQKSKTFNGYKMHWLPHKGGDATIIAVDGNKVVGSLFYGKERPSDETLKGAIEVRPEYRRQGIATALYVWAEQLSGLRFLPDEPHTEAAQALWGQRSRPFGMREMREGDGIGEAARRRVRETLIGERVVHAWPITIRMSGIEEKWTLFMTVGKTPPNGYSDAGRILIDIDSVIDGDPLAGLLWIEEHGQKAITHVWVDPEVQRQGVGQILVDVYRERVSGDVKIGGPFSDAGLRFARRSGAEIVEDAKSTAAPLDELIASTDARYPRAGEHVDGRRVRDHVPNLSSIDGYMDEQEELPGIRVVPMSDLGNPRSVFYAADDFERAEHLAHAIGRSGEISPLIIGVDEKGPFIIEGAHRFVALWHLKAKEFPAVVVVGQD
jgi:GNAT superfamily N-acetyltransferase